MNVNKNFNKGYRRDLLRLNLACGGVPYRSLELITNSLSGLQHWLRKMILEEDIFDKHVNKEIQVIHLTPHAIRLLSNPESEISKAMDTRLIKHFEDKSSRDAHRLRISSKSGKTDALRILRNNESLMFMFGCSMVCLPDEPKKVLDSHNDEPVILNSYYTSKELKANDSYLTEVEETEEKNKKSISATRLNGICLLKSGTYIVINLNHLTDFRISMLGELRSIEQTKLLAANNSIPNFSGGILFYKKWQTIARLVNPKTKKDKNSSQNLIEAYDEKDLFALPLTKEGQYTFELMKFPQWKKMICENILKEKNKETREDSSSAITGIDFKQIYDGKEKDGYFLFFCIPDIVRLKKYIHLAAEDEKNKYHIYCFTYQIELLTNICQSDNIVLSVIDVKKLLDSIVY